MSKFIEWLLQDDSKATVEAIALYDNACARLEERYQGKGMQLGGDDIVPEICVLLEDELMATDLLDEKLHQQLQIRAEGWSVADPSDMAKCAPVQMALVSHMQECRSRQQLYQLRASCELFLKALNKVITMEMFDEMQKNDFTDDCVGSALLDKAMAQQDLVGNMLTMIENDEESPAKLVRMFQAMYEERQKDIAIRNDPDTRKLINDLDKLLGLAVAKKTMIATMWEKTRDTSAELANKANDMVRNKIRKN